MPAAGVLLMKSNPTEPRPGEGLDQISTVWSDVRDPQHVVMRYAPAILAYLTMLLKNPTDAEDVAQDFLLRVIKDGIVHARKDRGRFRDYLKRAVRNAAITHLRKKRRPSALETTLALQAGRESVADEADRRWLADWQQCLLDRAWTVIEQHQKDTPGNLFHTVLQVAVENTAEDSESLAARLSVQIGRPVRADAFRKQLSRARHLFASALLDELSRTLDDSTPERIEEELVTLGLMPYVRDFLPPDWRTRGTLRNPE